MKKENRKYSTPGLRKRQPVTADPFLWRYRRPRKIKEIIDDTLAAIALAGAETAKKKPPGSLA